METKKLSPYEVRRRQEEEGRERDKQFQAELRAKAEQTVANAEAQEAQAEREQQAKSEQDFRATELQRYLAAGGNQMQFDADWPRLRQQLVEQRYLGNTAAPTPGAETAAAAKRQLDLLYKRT